MSDRHTAYRVCPFCEATCGVAIEVEGKSIISVRGDKDDPFSRGYICPKAYGLKEMYEDPDRLRRPVRRTASGWEEISWDEAYREVAARLLSIREKYGNKSVGIYAGNPVAHDFAYIYADVLGRALPGRTVFNSAAVDHLPKVIQTGLMFGGPFGATLPIPDIDRTQYLLIVGANPAVSHGSMMTMPDAPGRLKGVIQRGGKVVVIDPRRTETAKIASEHHFIRPGTDAAFMLAIVHTLFEDRRVNLGAAEGMVNGLDTVEAVARDFAPESVAGYCGIPAAVIRRIAREFASAPAAACYGRLGTCVQEFGTLASWGVDLINVLSGNLDRPGGVMFSNPAASRSVLAKGSPFEFGRWRSRVSGQLETGSMIPSSTMAEEILTEGDGQVRAMILLMTNTLRSAANSEQLELAFSRLDFLVALDFYINETTRYAHIILPTPVAAEQPHYEFSFYNFAVRNITKWSSAAVPASAETPSSWRVLLNLSRFLMGAAAKSEKEMDDALFAQLVGAMVKKTRRWPGLTAEEVLDNVAGEWGPERMADMLLRIGPYGDGFGRRPEGLTLAKVKANPHGIDLGPLEPRLHEIINTKSGPIELAPATMMNDMPRLRARMSQGSDGMVLIGRRILRTANSSMHNLPALVKGRDQCTLQISPGDAHRIGLKNRGTARVTSRAGSVVAPVEITDDLMPGVVSLPHGWGHNVKDSHLSVAKAHAGVNINALTNNRTYDEASGTAVLVGTPVTVEPATSESTQ
ncbi:MAG: molybdopterin-dependent oxidoreductase [Candidatus Binataceae bacterium]